MLKNLHVKKNYYCDRSALENVYIYVFSYTCIRKRGLKFNTCLSELQICIFLLGDWHTHIDTEGLTELTDTTAMHARLLSQGKHTDINSCLFELQLKTSSIQLALSKSCHSCFSVKYLPCSCSFSQYSGLYICNLLSWQL